jgi:hypothetical protein
VTRISQQVGPEPCLIVPDHVGKKVGQTLGREGDQDNSVGKWDSDFLLTRVAGLIHSEEENDLGLDNG